MDKLHTILVIDDEEAVVQSVRDLLRLDYHVLGATDARDAMSILGKERVHVVMTDQRMPQMSGVELLQRARETQPDAMRLLFTGYADVRAVIDAINRGNVYRYITKPWDPDELHGIIRDAVERHDLLAERQRLLGDLQRANDNLRAANAELVRASQLKSTFINVASHELCTPLSILVALCHVAVRRTDVPEPVSGWLRHMSSATDRMKRRVEQLITMLGVERFDQPLAARMVPLAALLRDAADDVQPFVEMRGQTLVRDYAGELGTIAVETTKIRDSLSQLLLNAVKFTPDGGRITLAAQRSADGAARISVADTGIGIDADGLSHIFEPFFTRFDVSSHSSGTYEYDRCGLGLGLTVAKAFVEMHGGRVGVESAPGRGSTFTVELPAGAPE